MKVSLITATLATAGIAIAAPRVNQRDLHPLSLTGLSASYYDQEKPESTVVVFDLSDPNTEINTSCSAVWSVGEAGFMKFNCTNTSYQLSFPQGIYNVEDFMIEIIRPDNSTALGRAYGNSWECEKHTGYPSETCSWDGVFYAGVQSQ